MSGSGPSKHPHLFAIVAALVFLCAAAVTAQTLVEVREDFQSFAAQARPPGWSESSPSQFSTWPDPFDPHNIVYGLKGSPGEGMGRRRAAS